MKVLVISKSGFGVTQYDGVTSILKTSSTITIAYGTTSTATVNTNTHLVRIIES